MKDKFEDIRPYRDEEARMILDRVLGDAEFIHAITRFRFPVMCSLFPWLIKPVVKAWLHWHTRKVNDVLGFQESIEPFMRHMIENTTSELTCSGLDSLDRQQKYLFISNHRDIAMDPGFVNWVLYHAGMGTIRIAIGDNLLTKPYASDLMRLNKSFLVNRSETAPKKLFVALKKLSAYIFHSLKEEHEHVWIAQREGRAKDGNDRTEPAILKMIAMAKPKDVSFADYIRQLNIVPVTISYEWDPCDYAKAREVQMRQQHGEYEKDIHEDVLSIARGIEGYKGHVHLAFGDVLDGDYETAEDVAAELDRQIIANYHLHPSNYLAAVESGAAELPDGVAIDSEKKTLFTERLQQCPQSCREVFLAMYANPLLNQSADHSQGENVK
jgi:1-acyl-sn-glycerol-3-phosphate acyltransferase